MDDLDRHRAANLPLRQHGEDAPVHAAMRADEMPAASDIEGRAVWFRILHVVKNLLNDRPPSDGDTVHRAPGFPAASRYYGRTKRKPRKHLITCFRLAR